MMYHVIYDGNCNLCVNFVKLLEQFDQGQQFRYTPMQDAATLEQFGITPQDCELGIILINSDNPNQRWQGSAAAEEIGTLLPAGKVFIEAYRGLPGAKWLGDRVYEQVRDHRYALFGKRDTYWSVYPCPNGACGVSDLPEPSQQPLS
jgi:predicted DCC family thiol-disulfide oxidoreductase YuxK